MRVELHFFDHVNWSDQKTIRNIKKLTKFLKENNILFFNNPEDPDQLEDDLTIEINRVDFSKLFVFIVDELKANPGCIHIPYQRLYLNGNGNYEFTNDSEVDDLANDMWQIRYLPRVNFNEKELKCIYCGAKAEYVANGMSFCLKHFKEMIDIKKKEAEGNKELGKKIDETTESIKRQIEDNKRTIAEVEEVTKTLSQKVKPREKQDMYR